jgi:hypothetical protein
MSRRFIIGAALALAWQFPHTCALTRVTRTR